MSFKAPPPPLTYQQQRLAYGPEARLLGIAHYDGYTAMTFAVEETGAVIRLRIEECEAARLAAQALPPAYRPARQAPRRRGLFPALHAFLFEGAQEKAGDRAVCLPDGMRFVPLGNEQQPNNSVEQQPDSADQSSVVTDSDGGNGDHRTAGDGGLVPLVEQLEVVEARHRSTSKISRGDA